MIIDMDNKYIGSIKFYKHLIITFYLVLMIIPSILIVFYYEHKENTHDNNILVTSISSNASVPIITDIDDTSPLTTTKANTSEVDTTNLDTSEIHTTKNEIYYPEIDPTNWKFILVNGNNPLPDDFECELARTYSGQYVDARIQDDLEAMIDAAIEAGHDVTICSAYRSDEMQWDLLQESVTEKMAQGYSASDAYTEAIEQLNAPGNSEHSTGLAVDIVGRSHQTLDYEQSETEEALWFAEHCAEYGFIVRYPEGAEAWTGISYESWHYRYVGVSAATYIMEKGITLEEFILTAPSDYSSEEDTPIDIQSNEYAYAN
ncbi:MAG: M15 family metallopeptidase [Eubacteriales bacterium]